MTDRPPPPRRALPPGPRSLRPSGLRDEIRRDVLGFYSRLAEEHPGIASFRVYWLRVVLVSDPTLVHEALRAGVEDLVQSRSLRALRVALGDGLLTAEGETWRRERARVQPAFRHDRLRQYAPMMVARTREAAETLEDGRRIDVHAFLSRLTLGVVAEALFGAELSDHVGDVGEGLGRVMDRFEEVFIRSRFPLPLTFPTPRNLQLRSAVRRLRSVVDAVVARRVEALGEGDDDLLADLLAATRAEGTPEARRRLRDEVLTLMLAGHETTALALSYALLLLSRSPEEERALVEELDAELGGRDPELDDLPRLPRLRRVVQETLRLYPPAWGLGREAVREIELGGYRIPKGAQLFLLPWVTHRDPRFFADAERFHPARWAPDAPPGSDGTPAVTREAYFPFGAGRRACVGAGFALMEAPLVLAILLRRWRFEVPPGFEPDLQPAVTLRPRGGVPALVRRR